MKCRISTDAYDIDTANFKTLKNSVCIATREIVNKSSQDIVDKPFTDLPAQLISYFSLIHLPEVLDDSLSFYKHWKREIAVILVKSDVVPEEAADNVELENAI